MCTVSSLSLWILCLYIIRLCTLFICSSFIGSVNRVMANFGYLQSHSLSQILKTHCCTFHGSALWHFNSQGFAKICTTWNKGVRTILKLPIRAHTYLLGPLLSQQNIHEQLYVRSIRCLYTSC